MTENTSLTISSYTQCDFRIRTEVNATFFAQCFTTWHRIAALVEQHFITQRFKGVLFWWNIFSREGLVCDVHHHVPEKISKDYHKIIVTNGRSRLKENWACKRKSRKIRLSIKDNTILYTDMEFYMFRNDSTITEEDIAHYLIEDLAI